MNLFVRQTKREDSRLVSARRLFTIHRKNKRGDCKRCLCSFRTLTIARGTGNAVAGNTILRFQLGCLGIFGNIAWLFLSTVKRKFGTEVNEDAHIWLCAPLHRTPLERNATTLSNSTAISSRTIAEFNFVCIAREGYYSERRTGLGALVQTTLSTDNLRKFAPRTFSLLDTLCQKCNRYFTN